VENIRRIHNNGLVNLGRQVMLKVEDLRGFLYILLIYLFDAHFTQFQRLYTEQV